MKRTFSSLLSALLLGGAIAVVGGAPASAKPCHDAKGKFVKCPSAASGPKKHCRDAKGKFVKCTDAHAMPAKM